VLSDELNKALGRAERGGAPFAVLLIDLDRFKPVNDIHGRSAGDFVLGEISARLKAVVRKDDTLARIGGDEFAIICELDREGRDLTKTPIALAERIIAAISAPVSIGARVVEVGASIAIAPCPADGMNGDALLHAADIAMYRAKQAGRGTFRFYEESMDTELRRWPRWRPTSSVPWRRMRSSHTISRLSNCPTGACLVSRSSRVGSIRIKAWSRPTCSPRLSSAWG
jgi:diguanylate cyclase (GGDEF)-like protein